MQEQISILFVEDSEDDADLSRLALENAGFAVDWRRVDTEEGFLEALRARRWDAIISDYQMPTFDGLRAFSMFQQLGLDTPFIFVSGALGEERAVEAMRSGARDYVLKGNLARLGVAVRRELQEAENRRRQRASEEAAQREQRCLALAMEATGAGVVEIAVPLAADTYMTGSWADALGWQPADIPPPEKLQAWFEDLVHPDDIARVRQSAQTFLAASGSQYQAEFRLRHKDGRWVDVECIAQAIQRDADGRASRVVAVVMDLTDRRKLEAQMRQGQKMEAVGRLAGGVAHDFNNMLTVILGYSDLLRINPQSPNATDSIEQIHSAATRAAGLTRQLLAFSRKQVISPRILNINSVVTEMSAMIQRLIGEDIDFLGMPSANVWRISADPSQIEQVIMNIAVNARDAMPQGGKLTLETRNVELDAEYCRRNPEVQPGPYVLLAVSDTGTGMVSAVQARIFEPFFTTKPQGKGTGLGLATVYGVIKQNRGHIAVYSELGKGTTFKVYWPKATREDTQAPTARLEEGLPKGDETILLVEDEDQVRAFASKMLAYLGYTVVEARDGMDALEKSRSASAQIDLLVTDVVMPKLGGPDLARQLTAASPQLKVLYVSGYTSNAIGHQGVLDKDVNFLAKPYSLQELARLVRTVLDS